MKQSTFTSIIAIVCFVVLILMASCGGQKTEKPYTDSTAQKPVVSPLALDKNLHVLYIETANIPKKFDEKKRLILAYYVNNSNVLTLRVWSPNAKLADPDNGDKFNTGHDLELKIGQPSALVISKGIGLANIVIYHDIVKLIKDNLDRKTYVIFVPEQTTGSADKNNGNITYHIGLTDVDPTSLTAKFRDEDFLGYANPTPPRNYDGSN